MICGAYLSGTNYLEIVLQAEMSRSLGQRSDFDFDDGFEQEERENDDSFEESIRKQLLKFRSGTERGNIFVY